MANTADLVTAAGFGALGGVMGGALVASGVGGIIPATKATFSQLISDPTGTVTGLLVPALGGVGLLYARIPQVEQMVPMGVWGIGFTGGFVTGAGQAYMM